jgi:hypothetical protein
MNETINYFNSTKLEIVPIQYDFFKSREESELECLKKEFAKVKESAEKVRKKLFAENSALKKKILEHDERIEVMERGLCRGKYD